MNMYFKYHQILIQWKTENTISDLYFNEERDYSEEETCGNKVFRSTILQQFQFKPEKVFTFGKESDENET